MVRSTVPTGVKKGDLGFDQEISQTLNQKQ